VLGRRGEEPREDGGRRVGGALEPAVDQREEALLTPYAGDHRQRERRDLDEEDELNDANRGK
jgi:hypothetical protein